MRVMPYSLVNNPRYVCMYVSFFLDYTTLEDGADSLLPKRQ